MKRQLLSCHLVRLKAHLSYLLLLEPDCTFDLALGSE